MQVGTYLWIPKCVWLWTESQPGCQHRPVEEGSTAKGDAERRREEAQLQILLAQLVLLGITPGWGRQCTAQSTKGMTRCHTAVSIQVTYGSTGTVEHSHHRRKYRFIHFPAIWGDKTKWVQIPSCRLWVPRKPGHYIIQRKGDSNLYSLCNAVRNGHFSTQWGSFCF